MTFSQNRGGPYARGWHTPPNPRTNNQLQQRTKLAQWAVAWRGLSAANQALWNTYAAAPAQVLTDTLGQPYAASGINWFVTVNTYRALMGLGQLSTAPTVAAPAAPVVPFLRFRTTANPALSTIRVTLATPTIALYHVLSVAIVNSLGINVSPAVKYYMVTQIPDSVGNITFGNQQATKFGTTYVGQRMFAELFALSTEGRYGASSFAQFDGSNTA